MTDQQQTEKPSLTRYYFDGLRGSGTWRFPAEIVSTDPFNAALTLAEKEGWHDLRLMSFRAEASHA